MSAETVPGEQTYCNVLFNTSGSDGRPIEKDISRRLWRKRERVRQGPENVTEKAQRIVARHPIVGRVVVWACLDCRWVVWGAEQRSRASEHPDGCLQRRQKPDNSADFPPKRVTRSAAELGAGGWGVYYDEIAPQRLAPMSYWHVGRTNRAAQAAQTLWSRREAFQVAEGRDLAGTHHVAVFTTYEGQLIECGGEIDDYVSRAICLTCTWHRFGAHLYEEPDWRPRVLGFAREHEVEQGGLELASWEELKRFDFGRSDIRVEADDDGRPAVVLTDQRFDADVRQRLEYPVSEGDIWRSIAYLRPHLEERIESIDLPMVSDSASTELVEALAQTFDVDLERIVESLGAGWTSCDDLVPDHYRAGRRWFGVAIGGPVIGIGRHGSRVATSKYAHGRWNPDVGEWVDVSTVDLLAGRNERAVEILSVARAEQVDGSEWDDWFEDEGH